MRKKEGSVIPTKGSVGVVVLLLLTFLLQLSNYKVIVLDGDTFVLNGKYIRIFGIDALELSSQKEWVLEYLSRFGKVNVSCLKHYAYEAKHFLQSLLTPFPLKIVWLDPKDRDKYGRILAYVYVCSLVFLCEDVGEELIRRGLALVFIYEDFDKKDIYLEIQDYARLNRLGLWACLKNANYRD